jgi:hypothetical protein
VIVAVAVVIAVMVMTVTVMLPFRVLFVPLGMMLIHPRRIISMPPVRVAPNVVLVVTPFVPRKSRCAKHREKCGKDN